ncbi:MAG: leucine-rich repeat protein, partial [Spirochaetales bacterium]|nr:leucine-rich repeat protein [Spirochaetales bacterium]
TGKGGAVVVPEGVQVIQEGAFSGKKITSLHLPSSVRKIGGEHISSAFWGGFDLKTIEVSGQNNDYSAIEDILYDKAVQTLLWCPPGTELTEAHIPPTVRKIADHAFDTCEKLTSVYIPDSLKSIGKAAFCACTGLKAIFISDTPRKIGKEAFEGCASLDEETCRKLRKWGYKGMITEREALDFVRKNPEQFNDVPFSLRTREVCLLGVKERGGICKLIPKALQSEEFFIEAVKVNINGKALKYVPAEFRTPKVCAAAVRKFPDAIEFVPEALKAQVKKAAKTK